MRDRPDSIHKRPTKKRIPKEFDWPSAPRPRSGYDLANHVAPCPRGRRRAFIRRRGLSLSESISLATIAPPNGRIDGRVLDAKHAPAAGIRVILGEIGHSLLIYNTPGEMFVATPGIFDPERKNYKAELATDRDGRFTAKAWRLGRILR